MKKALMIGITLSFFMAGPLAYAAGTGGGTHGTTMKHEAKKMSSHRLSAADVKALQGALNTHGAKLKVDGKMGKLTREAIKKFQKDNGLKVTGYANKKTREKLGVKF